MPSLRIAALAATLLAAPLALAQSTPDLPATVEAPATPSSSASHTAATQAQAAQAEAEPTTQDAAKGFWQPVSSTARAITGSVSLSSKTISINLKSFPLLAVRPLNPSEVNSVFNLDPPSATGGYLYRLGIAATEKFVKKNTLCGSDDTTFLVAFVQGRTLQLAFFSGSQTPTFTAEAIANTTALCGTYSYTK